MSYKYDKTSWNIYDETKTPEENRANNAIITQALLDKIESQLQQSSAELLVDIEYGDELKAVVSTDAANVVLVTLTLPDPANESVFHATSANILSQFISDNSPLMYYGTDSNNILGRHTFPISANTTPSIIRRVVENLSIGDSFNIDLIDATDGKAIITVFKECEGNTGVTGHIKELNEASANSLNHTSNIVLSSTNMKIQNSYEVTSVLRDDGFFEYPLNEFVAIDSITADE